MIENSTIVLYEKMDDKKISSNELTEILKKKLIPTKEFTKIIEVKNKIININNNDDQILKEVRDTLSGIKSKNPIENLLILSQLYKKADLIIDPIIGPLIKLFLSTQMNQAGQIHNYLDEILAINELSLMFREATISASKENLTIIIEILKVIHQNVNDRLLLKMFTLKFSKLAPTEFNGEIRRNFDVVLSEDEIKTGINSPRYKNYYLFWIDILQKRGMDLDLKKMIRKIVNSQEMIDSFHRLFPLLTIHFPTDENIKVAILKLMKESGESKDFWKKYVYLYLLDNLNIRTIYGKFEKTNLPASFNLKRNYFIELLNSGQARTFAVYNLLMLGDYSPELFFWIVL